MKRTDEANSLWWVTYARACSEIRTQNPKIADIELDKRAMSVADKAREEFMKEKANVLG